MTVYAGTVGAEVEILTGADLVTDVERVSIAVRLPNGHEAEWTPDSVDAAGTVTYRTKAGDIASSGAYVLQPAVHTTDGQVWPLPPVTWTVRGRFEVGP